MDASREMKAIHAARRAYKSAMALGAEKRIALDVACAAYRVAHPLMSNQLIQEVVAAKLGEVGGPARPARPLCDNRKGPGALWELAEKRGR